MSRKKKIEEESGADPFVVMMTALSMTLLAFFIVMCSLAVVDSKRVKKALGSLMGTFGPLPGGTSVGPGKTGPAGAPGGGGADAERSFGGPDLRAAKASLLKMESLILEKGLGKKMEVSVTREGVKVAFTGDIFFRTGKATLEPGIYNVLNELGKVISDTKHPVRIEGHTDNIPIHTKRYPSNWDLSVARAVNVLRYLVKKGYVKPGMISAVGYGPYRPVVPNDTPEGRTRNRRIDVVFIGTFL